MGGMWLYKHFIYNLNATKSLPQNNEYHIISTQVKSDANKFVYKFLEENFCLLRENKQKRFSFAINY